MKIEFKKGYTTILLLILVGAGLNVIGHIISSNASRNVKQYHNALMDAVWLRGKIKDLRSDVLLIETRVRGLVITEKSAFAKDIDIEFQNAFLDLNEIREKTRTKPEFTRIIDSLDHLIELKIQFQRQILELYRRNGKVEAEQIIATGTGKILREDILSGTTTLDGFVNEEISHIEDEINKERKASMWLAESFPYISMGIFCVLGFLLLRNVNSREKLMAHSNKAIEQQRTAYMVKDQFISNISHEVRTPLNSVIGYSGLLQKTGLTETQQKFVNAIQTSGENLLYIINELLDLGKIEEGLMTIHKEIFSLPDLIDQVALMFQEGFKKKNVQFVIDIEPSIKNLVGDNAKVRQVVVNLINNALKFTERGKVEVIVQQTNVTTSRADIQIIVRDTGIGISKEHLPRIFERFYQVQGANDRKYGGTGLGLSIIHQLIGLMGGTINVNSELNKGTEFKVEIPFDLPDSVEPEAYSITIKVPRDDRKKILVVDDNALNRDLSMHVLNSWNYEVRTVDSGIKALDRLRVERFDLVLMDVQMPGMDGNATTGKIRKELGSKIPIIALTAHSSKQEREKCIQAGMDEYVSKPFNELELFGIITKLLADPGPDAVNLDYLKSLSKGNLDFEHRILKRFAEEIPVQLNNLEDALFSRNVDAIRKVIHDMSANAGIVGLDEKLESEFRRMRSVESEEEMSRALESFKTIRESLLKSIDEISAKA